jgi:hypothetical protein
VSTRQWRPCGLLALGHGLPGVLAAAAGTGEQSLQEVGVLGPDFPQRLQGVQLCGTAACSGEPSLQVVGVLGSNFLHGLQEVQSCGASAGLGEQSL